MFYQINSSWGDEMNVRCVMYTVAYIERNKRIWKLVSWINGPARAQTANAIRLRDTWSFEPDLRFKQESKETGKHVRNNEKTKNAKRTPSVRNEETNKSERTDRKPLSGRHVRSLWPNWCWRYWKRLRLSDDWTNKSSRVEESSEVKDEIYGGIATTEANC